MEQSNTTEEQSNQPLLESPNSPTWTPMKWVDILLTSTVLSFFVVAGWRGLMGLMNLYPEYFPINETFFLSVFIFVVFAASQSFLNDVLLERPAKSWFMKLVYFLVTKTYIYIFYFNSVMNFNTCEIILGNINQSVQEYGVRLNVWDKGSPVATVLIIFVLNALLIWIRGVKNLLGAPMVLFIDTKEDTFVCDYNFFKILYLVMVINEETDHLTADARIQSTNYPRPFEVEIIGLRPQRFTPTPPTLPPTTKRSTTVNHPNHKQHFYPKSIQDVIKYVTDNPALRSFTNIGEEVKRDEFRSFKPEDPSDINLLATGSVRFAPPVWKRFNRYDKKPIPVHTYVNTTNLNRFPVDTDVLATVRKPLLMSINIVPMDSSSKKGAMTLNLKVFPDMTQFNEDKTNIYKI